LNTDQFFEEFIKAYKLICKQFGLESLLHEVRRLETKHVGLDYISYAQSQDCSINFSVRSNSDDSDIIGDSVTVSLEIETPKLFRSKHLQAELTRSKFKKGFLQRWSLTRIRQFGRWLEAEPIDVIFHDMDVRVYGLPGSTRPTVAEFVTVIAGLEKRQQPRKLLVYRFHHHEKYSEAEFFSYALWICVTDYDFWIVFPNAAGLSGGENFRDYCFIEELLENASRKLKPDIRDLDVDYEDLEGYLLQHAVTFGSRESEVNRLKAILKIISEGIYFVLLIEGDDDEAAAYMLFSFSLVYAILIGIPIAIVSLFYAYWIESKVQSQLSDYLYSDLGIPYGSLGDLKLL